LQRRGSQGYGQSSSAYRRLAAVLALLVGLGACAPAPRPVPGAPAVPAAAALPAGPAYRVDPARSSLRILVYRAGALARLGHNHVLESHELAGDVHLAAAGAYAGAGFALRLPVASLIVDDAAARGEEGAEFATEPTPADIEGTRRNLLSPGVLDALAHPVISLDGTTVARGDALVALARITVAGHASTLEVPLAVTAAPGTLTLRGGFGVAQTALGLVPFSLALGALSVRDELEVRFTLVATASP